MSGGVARVSSIGRSGSASLTPIEPQLNDETGPDRDGQQQPCCPRQTEDHVLLVDFPAGPAEALDPVGDLVFRDQQRGAYTNHVAVQAADADEQPLLLGSLHQLVRFAGRMPPCRNELR